MAVTDEYLWNRTGSDDEVDLRVLYHGAAPDPVALGLAAFVTLLFGIWGVRSFWKHEHRFADLI